jgi:hypothetical protein
MLQFCLFQARNLSSYVISSVSVADENCKKKTSPSKLYASPCLKKHLSGCCSWSILLDICLFAGAAGGSCRQVTLQANAENFMIHERGQTGLWKFDIPDTNLG